MKLTVREITSYSDFLTLRAVWDQLAEQNSLSVPFLTFDWTDLWWQSFLDSEPVRILLVEEDGVAKAIAPFYFAKQQVGSFWLKGWNGMANAHTNRYDFLIGDKQPIYYELILDHLLRSKPDWDLLALMLIPAESTAAKMLNNLAQEYNLLLGNRPGICSPYIRIEGNWQSYLNSLGKKSRYVLRKAEKEWQATPAGKEMYFDKDSDVEFLIDAIHTIETHSWKAKAQKHLMKNDQVWDFYSRLIRRAAERGWLQACLLCVEQTPIAYELALRFKNILYSLKISYDDNYSALKPGMLIQIKMIQRALELGVSEKDLLGDLDPWKLHLTKLSRPHYYHFIFKRKPYPAMVWGTEFLLRPTAGKIKRRLLHRTRKETDEE